MMNRTPLRVLIVEDNDLVRQYLSILLSRRNEFAVVGEAATAAEALEKVSELQPDIVVIASHLPDQSGIETSREIRAQSPDTRVLILTSHGDDRAIIGSIMAGASGYLLKGIDSQEIVEAIRNVGQGRSLLNPAIAGKVLERIQMGTREDDQSKLTSIEQQIFELVTRGKTDQEIATEVFLTETTVRSYISAIHGKLEIVRRSQAAAFAVTWRTRR
jgi:two-component system, NarL family, response regulator DevR